MSDHKTKYITGDIEKSSLFCFEDIFDDKELLHQEQLENIFVFVFYIMSSEPKKYNYFKSDLLYFAGFYDFENHKAEFFNILNNFNNSISSKRNKYNNLKSILIKSCNELVNSMKSYKYHYDICEKESFCINTAYEAYYKFISQLYQFKCDLGIYNLNPYKI